MSTKQWAMRYMRLRGGQNRVQMEILRVAKFVYTKPHLNKMVLRKDFYTKCLSDLKSYIEIARKNYRDFPKPETKCKKIKK